MDLADSAKLESLAGRITAQANDETVRAIENENPCDLVCSECSSLEYDPLSSTPFRCGLVKLTDEDGVDPEP